MQTRKGQSIEDASMAVIEKEIGEHHYDKMQWPIVRRVIHSTADFDFAGSEAIKFSPNSITNGINAIKQGCSIITDVHGVSGLLSKSECTFWKPYHMYIDSDISDKVELQKLMKRTTSSRR